MIVLALSALLCLGISSAFLQSPLQRSRSGLVTRSGQTSFNSGHDPDMLDGSRPAFQMKELKTARDKASFKNKVPFDSDIYDIIRKLVELLGKRIETKAPLTPEEARWFGDNLPLMLDDADKYGPPPRPVNQPRPPQE